MAEGYMERLDLQMYLLAWHASNIMNVHLRRKITPDKLLKKKKQTKSEESIEQRKSEFEALMEELGT
jgi:hypothetical protein